MTSVREMSSNMVEGVVESQENGSAGEILGTNTEEIGEDIEFEPRKGIEFDSNEAAYSFYQEYAKSMGFTTSIRNSRRSKKSKEFIDAKFACSRYGVSPESDGGSSRRPIVKKTDCKASMHVKRRKDGKWYIHEFIKEHNHELLPALAYHFCIHRNVKLAEKNNMDILQAVSERTRKMYVEMSRHAGSSQSVGNSIPSDVTDHDFERGRYLALEEGDAQLMLNFFMNIQKENPSFFYAIDLNEDQRLRNLLWVDAKGRSDYKSFSDAVFFDTNYININDKFPFAPFIGVNHHHQPMLLGCALVADKTKSTYVWVMKTWLRAMNGQAPKLIITDQDKNLKEAIEVALPTSRHCFALWHVLEKIPEAFAHVIERHDNFMEKFNKCISKSLTDDQFDMRWWKIINRFELQEDDWVISLYEDRKKWAPTYLRDTFFAGLSTHQRADGMNSYFDKYIHKKITLKEFVKQYGTILQNRYEEEAVADFDTLHKQPALKSPSPWEKQMSTLYTHTIFKKFQVEVLGVVGCHPRKETEDENSATFRVDDCEKDEHFMVLWNKAKLIVSCSCLLFEFEGFLCRHAMIVLQICGLSSIPSHHILKRWTKDAKNSGGSNVERTDRVRNRVQRYNELCKRAIELGEEGSLSEGSYKIAFSALVEALNNCVNVNNNKSFVECSNSALSFRDLEEENLGSLSSKSTKKRSANRKQKAQSTAETMIIEPQDSLQPMENLSADDISLAGYYGSQQSVQGLLNLMEPPHDGYYVNQQSMQGLGPLSSLAAGDDGFFGAQQTMNGMGHLDFRAPSSFSYSLQDEPNLRNSQLHSDGSRHAS